MENIAQYVINQSKQRLGRIAETVLWKWISLKCNMKTVRMNCTLCFAHLFHQTSSCSLNQCSTGQFSLLSYTMQPHMQTSIARSLRSALGYVKHTSLVTTMKNLSLCFGRNSALPEFPTLLSCLYCARYCVSVISVTLGV